MKRTSYGFILAGVLAFAVPLVAQKPADAPANATAQCTDGTFSTAKTQQGACGKHGGVKTWFGPAAGAAASDAKKNGTESKSTGAPPAGSTGQCADGSYTKAKTQSGACSQHGGVKTWFAATGAAATAAPAPPAATPKTPPVAATKNPPVAATKNAPPSGGASASSGTGKAPATHTETIAKPAGAPADATGQCKDGSFTTSKTHSGACSHHGGVAEWFK